MQKKKCILQILKLTLFYFEEENPEEDYYDEEEEEEEPKYETKEIDFDLSDHISKYAKSDILKW